MSAEICKQEPDPCLQVALILGTAFVLLLFISTYMTSLMNDQIETLSNIKFLSIRSHTQADITASKASTGSPSMIWMPVSEPWRSASSTLNEPSPRARSAPSTAFPSDRASMQGGSAWRNPAHS